MAAAKTPTPRQVMARNLAAARVRRGLEQAGVAARMRALGYGWKRQTVGEIEAGRRRLLAEEAIALMAALDVSVTSLMFPGPDDNPAVELPGGQIITLARHRALDAPPGIWPGFHIPDTELMSPVKWDEDNQPKFSAPGEDGGDARA